MKRFLLFSVLFLASLNINSASNSLGDTRMLALSGRVLNDDSQDPIIGFVTVSVDGYDPIRITTNSNGEFSAMIPVVAEYKVQARAAGFETQEEIVSIPDFELETSSYVELKLMPSVKLVLDVAVRDSKDQKAIASKCNVYYNSDFIKADSKPAINGRFNASLTHFGWYLVDFSAPGYKTVVDTFWVLNYNRKVVHKDYFLSRIDTGSPIQLQNVNFKFGSATITTDSYQALNDLAQFLKKNPTLQIEISGHTDNEGPDQYNLFLSQIRAQAVVDYLVDNGILVSRLIANGYGETRPLVSNETENGKALNRRVEFVVNQK